VKQVAKYTLKGYAKNELEDLTTNEIKLLKRIVEEWDND
jgi:succinate dehydrogenase flavin-adding protein (antitoxin of CptAB toxin-antitoxin module)